MTARDNNAPFPVPLAEAKAMRQVLP